MQYMNNLTYLSSEAFSSIPHELVTDLKRMLSANEALRPSALDFTGMVSKHYLNYKLILLSKVSQASATTHLRLDVITQAK